MDCDGPTGKRDYSDKFEIYTYLPMKYTIYMKGLWHLDRLELDVSSLLETWEEIVLIGS